MLIHSVAETLKDTLGRKVGVKTPSEGLCSITINDSDVEVRVVLARAEYGNRRIFRIHATKDGHVIERKATESFNISDDAEAVKQGQRAIMFAAEFVIHAVAKAHMHLQEA